MSDIRRVGEAGIHTVEGNIAGSRAAQLVREREKQQAEYEALKKNIKSTINATGDVSRINDKFTTAVESGDSGLTVGLVTAEEFKKIREAQQRAEEEKRVGALRSVAELDRIRQAEHKVRAEDREVKRRKLASTLSFGADEEEEDEPPLVLKKKITKDPTVDTSFLPDADRERELALKREELRKEWLEQQEIIKNELVEVTYSYWDGTGHRKVITVKKGLTIGKFLEQVKQQLVSEFTEVRTTNCDDLMYIKEDLIIPHHYSFYDLIITKARGKSGPLFHFDVHDDVRLLNDATVEKDESHPGKVCERRWYERNKHIFPASRWEVYDPSVQRGKYTIHGGDVNTKK